MYKREYKTRCNGRCKEQVNNQAETIKALRESNVTKTKALIKARNQIAKLEAEKMELTDTAQQVSERNKVLEKELEYWKNRESGEAWF